MKATHKTIFYNVAKLEDPPVKVRYFVEIPGKSKYCLEDVQQAVNGVDSQITRPKSLKELRRSSIPHFETKNKLHDKISKDSQHKLKEILRFLKFEFLEHYEKQLEEIEDSSNEDLKERTRRSSISSVATNHSKLTGLKVFTPEYAEIDSNGKKTKVRIRPPSPPFECMYSVVDVKEALKNLVKKDDFKLVLKRLDKGHFHIFFTEEFSKASKEIFIDEKGLLRAIGTLINKECHLLIVTSVKTHDFVQYPTKPTEQISKGKEMSTENNNSFDKINSKSLNPDNERSGQNRPTLDYGYGSRYPVIPEGALQKIVDVNGNTIYGFIDKNDEIWYSANDTCLFDGRTDVRKMLKDYGITDPRIFIYEGQQLLFLSQDGLDEILNKSTSRNARLYREQIAQKLITNPTPSQNPSPAQQFDEALKEAIKEGEGFIPEPASAFQPEDTTPAPSASNSQEAINPESQSERSKQQVPAEELENKPKEKAEWQPFPPQGFTPEVEAHAIYRQIQTELDFDQWLDQQIRIFRFKEGVDFVRDKYSDNVYLNKKMANEIIQAIMAERFIQAHPNWDDAVNAVNCDGMYFRFIDLGSDGRWYLSQDLQRYLGEEEVQNAIDTYGTPNDPLTLETSKAQYLCFSEDTFKKMLANSQNEKIRNIYVELFGNEEPSEEPTSENKEEPETELTLTPEPSPADQTTLESPSSSSDTEQKASAEENIFEIPKAQTPEEAISATVKPFNGKYFWVIDAKSLHSYLNSPEPYPSWIIDLIDNYGYIENTDYIGDKESGEFLLSLPMAREVTMTVPGGRGQQAHKYLSAFSESPIADADAESSNPSEPSFEDDQEEIDIQETKPENFQEEPSEEPTNNEVTSWEVEFTEQPKTEESESESKELETEESEPESEEPEIEETEENEEETEQPEAEEKTEVREVPRLITAWTTEEVAENLGIESDTLNVYLQQIGWLLPNSLEPAHHTTREGLMVLGFEESRPDETIGLLTEKGLETVRQKLVYLGIIPPYGD